MLVIVVTNYYNPLNTLSSRLYCSLRATTYGIVGLGITQKWDYLVNREAI